MCLIEKDEVTKEYTEGYKVFTESNGEIGTPFYIDYYPKNEWVRDKKDMIINKDYKGINNLPIYETGYHFFETLQDCIDFISHEELYNCAIYKIKVRNMVASGKQYTNYTIDHERCSIMYNMGNAGVAKEMYIEEKIIIKKHKENKCQK